MKNTLKSITNKLGYKIVNLRHLEAAEGSSNLEEDKIIKKYTKQFTNIQKYCVDIGASDGINMSNTHQLFKSKWKGLAVECDQDKFYKLADSFKNFDVDLAKTFVTPDNVLNMFESFDVPKDFGLLSLDIDGYDYYVLEKILEEYKPSIICAEINEKIPPPIKFTVKYKKGYFWNNSHFYGQSLAMLDELCVANNYNLAEVHYNNAFYVSNKLLKRKMSVEEGYNTGYKNKKDRKEKFPWNSEFDEILELDTKAQKKFINNKFRQYNGKYILK